MKELIKKWIKEHNDLLEQEMAIYDKYGGDIEKMPDNIYTKYRVIMEKRLTIYDHIKEIQDILLDDIKEIKQLEI